MSAFKHTENQHFFLYESTQVTSKESTVIVSVDTSDVDFLQNLMVYFTKTNEKTTFLLDIALPAFFKHQQSQLSEELYFTLSNHVPNIENYFGFYFTSDDHYNHIEKTFPEQVSFLKKLYESPEIQNDVFLFTQLYALTILLVKHVYDDCKCKSKIIFTFSYNETQPFSLETVKIDFITYYDYICKNYFEFQKYLKIAECVYRDMSKLIIEPNDSLVLTSTPIMELMKLTDLFYIDLSGSAAFFNGEYVKLLSNVKIELCVIMGGVMNNLVPFTSGPFPTLRRSSASTMNQTMHKTNFSKLMKFLSQMKVSIVAVPNSSIFTDDNIVERFEQFGIESLTNCNKLYYESKYYLAKPPKKPYDYINGLVMVNCMNSIDSLHFATKFKFTFNSFGQTIIKNENTDVNVHKPEENNIFNACKIYGEYYEFDVVIVVPYTNVKKLEKSTQLNCTHTPYGFMESNNYELMY